MNQQHLTALHEAGHTYASWRLGLDVGPVTVASGKVWAGLARTLYAPIADTVWENFDPSVPYLAWPAELRQGLDARATVAAAGEVAETALAPLRGTYTRAAPLTDRALDIATSAPPSRAEEVALELARNDTAMHTDAEALGRLGRLIYPADGATAARWLAYITAETQALILAGAQRIFTLADALTEHGTLSGTAARTILENGCSSST